MSNVTQELAALEAMVNEQQRQLNNSIRTTLIVYAVLVLAVIGYTTFVFSHLKHMTSPEAVTELATGWLNSKLPARREAFLGALKDNSDKWAKSSATYVTENMPALEAQIEGLLDSCSDMLVEHLEAQLIPAFTEFIAEDADELRTRYKDLKDDEAMQGLALLFIDVIEKEMDRYFNDKFIDSVAKLQRQLHDLAQPGRKLTKREAAERKVIQCWVFLSEHNEYGVAILVDVLKTLKERHQAIVPVKDEALPGVEKGFEY